MHSRLDVVRKKVVSIEREAMRTVHHSIVRVLDRGDLKHIVRWIQEVWRTSGASKTFEALKFISFDNI